MTSTHYKFLLSCVFASAIEWLFVVIKVESCTVSKAVGLNFQQIIWIFSLRIFFRMVFVRLLERSYNVHMFLMQCSVFQACFMYFLRFSFAKLGDFNPQIVDLEITFPSYWSMQKYTILRGKIPWTPEGVEVTVLKFKCFCNHGDGIHYEIS